MTRHRAFSIHMMPDLSGLSLRPYAKSLNPNWSSLCTKTECRFKCKGNIALLTRHLREYCPSSEAPTILATIAAASMFTDLKAALWGKRETVASHALDTTQRDKVQPPTMPPVPRLPGTPIKER